MPRPVPVVRMPWSKLAAFFAFALIATAIGSLVIRAVDAATFQGPTQAAPGGNVPLTIWNRVAATARQATAAIEIDGGGPGPTTATGISVGTNTLNLGNAAGGQNLFYGVADFANMNNADYLLLLQTAAAGPTYSTRFMVDKNGHVVASGNIAATGVSYGYGGGQFGGPSLNLGNAAGGQNAVYVDADYGSMHPTGDFLMKMQTSNGGIYTDRMSLNRDGDLKAAGCFGKTLVGLTTSAYQPAGLLSYVGADNRCNTDFPGSHVCKVDEILESIQCRHAGDPIITLGGSNAWINGGPPGINTANANDCIGWTSSAASSFGRVWVFDNTTGGFGTLTGCNIGSPGLKVACCK